MDKYLGLSILCVEDDPDTAEVVVELLRREGYEVAVANDAERALELLRERRFDLLVSDYMLPDKTGTTLLKEATGAGLLKGTALILFTAHPDPEKIEGLEVLRKPLAVDAFLRKVYEVLTPAREAEVERTRKRMAEALPVRVAVGPGVKAELVLYISSSSPASLRALRNMHLLLTGYDTAQVRFTVIDLARETSPWADEDRIAFTPTLVQRSPAPRTWILGDLADIKIVADLLAHAGVDKRR